MEKVLTEIQKLNSNFELMEQRLSSLERNNKVLNRRILTLDQKIDAKEKPLGMKILGRSNMGAEDEPQPCSSRDVMEGDIALNERGPLPGMFN